MTVQPPPLFSHIIPYQVERATLDIQKELSRVAEGDPVKVEIPGTRQVFRRGRRRHVTVDYLRNETIRKITAVNLDDKTDTLHELQQPSKVAALVVLNGFFRIKLFYWILWRWYFYIRQYKAEQLYPIIAEGKKKVPQIGFLMNTTLTASMRDTVKAMTRAEVEHTQAALSSAGKGL